MQKLMQAGVGAKANIATLNAVHAAAKNVLGIVDVSVQVNMTVSEM